MTREQDIERVLDGWLAEGPTQMPSRFLDDTLDRIDRAPQRRFVGLRPRLSGTKPNPRLAAAAAIVLLIAGIGMTVISRAPAVGVGPSPIPTAVPSASAQAITDMGQIESRWLSTTPRQWSALPEVSSTFLITIGSTEMVINNFKGDVSSAISLIRTNSLNVTLHDATVYSNCHLGDEGTYAIGLSPAGDILTLTAVTDPCSARRSILDGDWARSNCPSGASCLGDLQAGRHVTEYFHAYLAAPDQLAYVVPEGWSNTNDGPTYVLAKRNAPANTGIYLFPGVFPQSQADDCAAGASKDAERSAKTLADWLTTLPGLVTTEPTPVKIGALTGFAVDVSIAPGWTQTCPNGQGKPVINTFTSADFPDSSYRVALIGEARDRYVFLDLSDGNTLLIDVTAPDKATFDDLVPEAMQIVESFRFTP
jgi:hypothetical protein